MTKAIKIFFIGLAVVDVVAVNIGVGYLLSTNKNTNLNEQLPIIKTVDQCGVECQKYIDDKINLLDDKYLVAGPSGTITPTSKPVVVKASPTRTKVRSVTYVTIPGGGSTMSNSWVDLAGTNFYFDTADYSGLVEVYFEATMKLFNGNGMAYIQLYDTNHGIGVQGSDVSTNSQSSSVVTSGKVSFWAGKNLIRVQAKSLTADTAVYDSGRLRIVTEN